MTTECYKVSLKLVRFPATSEKAMCQQENVPHPASKGSVYAIHSNVWLPTPCTLQALMATQLRHGEKRVKKCAPVSKSKSGCSATTVGRHRDKA